MAIAKNIEQEIDELVRRIRAVSNNAKKESKQAFRAAAKPIISAIQERAPVSNEPHSRYNGGKKVATYYPGNLKRSIKVLALRRAQYAVYIGPRMVNESTGEFKGQKTDGYYAHLMEFEYGLGGRRPQPFIRPGAIAAAPQALRIATAEINRSIQNYARRYEQVRAR